MRHPCLLSVVVPTYNRRELVQRAVLSVLGQRASSIDIEIIVVDDGSTDGTAAALRERFRDEPRVQCLETPHAYASAARNRGFALARGDLVCFLDSDDYWLPGTLAAIEAVFARHPHLAFVSVDGSTSAQTRIVAGNAPGWSHARFPRETFMQECIELADGRTAALLIGDFFPAIVFGDLFYLSGLVLRRESVTRAGPFNERLRFHNDWEFFARACLQGLGAHLDIDGFRRETGRDDQISRRHPRTAMPRRHLLITRSLRWRGDAARHARRLREAHNEARYAMARALLLDAQRRRARRYLYHCIQRGHKTLRCLILFVFSFLPRRRSSEAV